MGTRWFWTGLRWLYALLFLVTGAMMLAAALGFGADPFRQPTPAAQAWMDGVSSAPFFLPLLGGVYVAGGLCLLVPRAVPLGLVVLSGPVSVIVAYHAVLSGLYVTAVLLALAHTLLVWRYRRGFAPLWRYREEAR
jgi:low temperature requirement protein LtrA